MTIRVRRAYDPPAAEDGCRVLVDRLWPRGLARENARIEHWLRELAPSNELRKWFAHDPDKFAAFKERYEEELLTNPPTAAAVAEILKQLTETDVTLVYAARDPEINHVVVLRDFVESQRK